MLCVALHPLLSSPALARCTRMSPESVYTCCFHRLPSRTGEPPARHAAAPFSLRARLRCIPEALTRCRLRDRARSGRLPISPKVLGAQHLQDDVTHIPLYCDTYCARASLHVSPKRSILFAEVKEIAYHRLGVPQFHEISTAGGTAISINFWFEEQCTSWASINTLLLPHSLLQLSRDAEFLLADILGARNIPEFLSHFLPYVEKVARQSSSTMPTEQLGPTSRYHTASASGREEWSSLQQTLLTRLSEWLGTPEDVLSFCTDFLHPLRFEGLTYAT